MAEFCKQDSIDIFGENYGDFKGLTTLKDWEEGKAALVLCEGCGPIQVDPEGQCVADCIKSHKTF